MLLNEEVNIVGPVSSSPPSFVAIARDGTQATVVGRAPRTAIAEAASRAGEIVVVPDDAEWVSEVLPDWTIDWAFLYRRPARAPLSATTPGDVRFLAEGELASLSDLPEDLRDELRLPQAKGKPIAVALEGGLPVAFCYAGSMTETLWDVSIDTLEPYQRRGHATKAASFLIAYYAEHGKEPVWGALTTNDASQRLAARLGFAKVGDLLIYNAPKPRR
jgi:GNAT superfamily N-acetyltransferase